MSSFWPEGIKLSDTQAPREILEAAQEDWQTNSDGIMDLILQDAESESGNSMIVVHAKHVLSNRTATLFSVVHRPDHPYPVTIQIKEENLPNFLKKSYYRSGSASLFGTQANIASLTGGTVSNRWVSDTPPEFREKLADAFNLGAVKGEILNLASTAKESGDSNNEESLPDLEEN